MGSGWPGTRRGERFDSSCPRGVWKRGGTRPTLLGRLDLHITQVLHLARPEGQVRNQGVEIGGVLPGKEADFQARDHARDAEPSVLADVPHAEVDPDAVA